MKLEKYKEAIEDYTEALKLDSTYYFALNNRGIAKIETKNYIGAIEDFTLCLEIKNNYYSAISNRGIAYYKAKKYKEAINDFNTLIAINPSDGNNYLHRGNTKEMLRDKEGACEDWKKAAELGVEAAKKYVTNECK
jgi:tetratricopeptide (TPR) repeat protein